MFVNLPGISYSRNRTSRNPQVYGPVCSIESPNNVAISIGIVATCPAILCPFGWSIDLTVVVVTVMYTNISIVSMLISFVIGARANALRTNWWFRLDWHWLCFSLIPGYYKRELKHTRGCCCCDSVRCFIVDWFSFLFTSFFLFLCSVLYRETTTRCAIWECFHAGFIVITEIKAKEKIQILALSK